MKKEESTMPPDTIDAAQCADLLRCTPEHIEEMARAGEIPGLKIGRSWVFVRFDLLDYLAEKAREDAQARRAKRSPAPAPAASANQATPITSRRRVPPPLPVPLHH